MGLLSCLFALCGSSRGFLGLKGHRGGLVFLFCSDLGSIENGYKFSDCFGLSLCIDEHYIAKGRPIFPPASSHEVFSIALALVGRSLGRVVVHAVILI